MKIIASILLSLLLVFETCDNPKQKEIQSSNSTANLWVKMLVEIPAGTIEKYELNKENGELEQDSVDGKPRLIKYLGYPANYGMIPETILSKSDGGDGDPLDIIAIGPPSKIGDTVECKVIGILKLKDRGEHDDKLIAISKNSTLEDVNSLADLKLKYPGISEIIEIWFTNYKGQGKMISQGYREKNEAKKLYLTSKNSYKGL